jgi:DNA-directed RNA polymerase subunit RPC12/RpoP
MTTTMTSRALKLQIKLSRIRCPKCGKRRLIQSRPMHYDVARCLNCGGKFSVKRKEAA